MDTKSTVTNEDILKQLSILQDQIIISQKQNKDKTKHKGTYELISNGTAKLQYMYKGERFYDRRPAQTDAEALHELALFVDECEKGTFINNNYTFAEFSQICIDQKVRPNADERYVDKMIAALNNRILPYLGKYKLKEITKQILENYYNTIKETTTKHKGRKNNQKVKPASVDKWKMYINNILNYAVDCDLLLKNPGKGIKISYSKTNTIEDIKALVNSKNKDIHYYDTDTYKLACNILENEFKSYYYDTTITIEKRLREVARRLIILLALKTGMRRSEIFGLARNEEFNDLDTKNEIFNVNKSRHYSKSKGRYTKIPKTISSIRIKSLPKSILSYIKLYFELLDSYNYKNMYIFDFISIDGICSWFDEWQDKNNITNIRFHDLRHTHATILLRAGVDIKTISERLGHKNIQTTLDIYADVLKELDQEASNKLDLI